jgi:radical SAM protein with 4Fe4S-binding SPASM domain
MDHIPLLYPLIYSQRNHYGCAAGISYCAVAPDGGLYPCHTLTGSPSHRLGHIREGIDEKKQRESFIQRVENRPACAACWARYLCGGGSSLKDREPAPADCETFRSFMHKLLLLYDALDMNDKEAIRYSRQQMDRFLPHIKKLAAPAQTGFQGETLLTVRSDSMNPTLKAGDRVVVVPVNGEKIRTGDIVCYGRPVVCHRVIARFKRGGETRVIEKGDNTIAGKNVLARQITGRVIAIQNSNGRQDITTRGQRARQYSIAILSLSRHLLSAALFKIKRGGQK